MDMVRPACAGLAVWLAAWYVEPAIVLRFVTLDRLGHPLDRALVVLVPELVIGVLVAALAALAHRAPSRGDRRRHAIAVLGTVALVAVITVAAGLVSGVQGWAVLTRLAADLAGGGLGWALLTWIRLLRARSAARGTYF
ncbi:MAG TPA: hypothetical protein VGL93_13935 [Streptosporangiaceae bacterium]|jgi:hypothetical protein